MGSPSSLPLWNAGAERGQPGQEVTTRWHGNLLENPVSWLFPLRWQDGAPYHTVRDGAKSDPAVRTTQLRIKAHSGYSERGCLWWERMSLYRLSRRGSAVPYGDKSRPNRSGRSLFLGLLLAWATAVCGIVTFERLLAQANGAPPISIPVRFTDV